jgi:hypothetical protein
MKPLLIITTSLVILISFSGCKRGVSVEDRAKAQSIANAGECFVSATSNGSPSPTVATGENCDLQVFFSRPGGKPHEFYLGIYKDHTQYTELSSLRVGDKVKFQYVEEPQQSERNPATHIRFNRLYR